MRRLSSLDLPLRRRPRAVWAAVLVLTAAGAWLRFHDLGAQPLWYDEIAQSRTARGPFLSILGQVWQWENDMPIDPWIQHFFLVAGGDSEFSIRVPAALWGSLSIVAIFLLMRSLFGPTAGLAAAALLAFSPLHRHYSQEGRPYALLLLLTTLSTWALWSLARRRARRGRWWVLYAVTAPVSLWTHVLAIITIGFHQVWIWSRWGRAALRGERSECRLRWIAVGSFVIALVCAMSLVPVWGRISGTNPSKPFLPFEPLTLHNVGRYLSGFAFGHDENQQPPGSCLWALPVLAIGLVWGLRRRPAGTGLMLLLFLGTVGSILFLCHRAEHWFSLRYSLAALVPFLGIEAVGAVAIAEGLGHLFARGSHRMAQRRVFAGATLALATVLGGALASLYLVRHQHRKDDWRSAAVWMRDHVPPGVPVLIPDPVGELALRYYLEQIGAPVQVELLRDRWVLMARAEQCEECFVALPPHLKFRDEWNWLWGQPQAPLDVFGVNLYQLHHDPAAWVRERASLIEAATADFERGGRRLDIGQETFAAIGPGWGYAENFGGGFPFRWTASSRATLLLPLAAPRDLVLTLRACAYQWEGAPPQRTVIQVNGQEVAEGVIEGAWSTYGVVCPRSVWVAGSNRVDFECDHTAAPAEVRRSPDHRLLGIGVDWIELDEAGGPPPGVVHDWSHTRLIPTDAAGVAAAARQFAADGLRVDIGAENVPAIGPGWHPPEVFNDEHTFRWTRLPTAELRLPLEEPRDLCLAFRATTFAWEGAPPQRTVVRINGREAAEGVIETGWSVYGLRCPEALWRSGVNTVEFAVDHTASPRDTLGVPDTRPLGIGVDWVQLFDGLDQPSGVDHGWSDAAPAP
jgi:4-amino-4-deoxy-L-arabinose transferase-like glycosyltransferase